MITQYDGKKRIEIDTGPIEEMKSKLEKELLNERTRTGNEMEILNEAFELSKEMDENQMPYYINMLIHLLHRTSGMYKWASSNPKEVIQYNKIYENVRKKQK